MRISHTPKTQWMVENGGRCMILVVRRILLLCGVSLWLFVFPFEQEEERISLGSPDIRPAPNTSLPFCCNSCCGSWCNHNDIGNKQKITMTKKADSDEPSPLIHIRPPSVLILSSHRHSFPSAGLTIQSTFFASSLPWGILIFLYPLITHSLTLPNHQVDWERNETWARRL